MSHPFVPNLGRLARLGPSPHMSQRVWSLPLPTKIPAVSGEPACILVSLGHVQYIQGTAHLVHDETCDIG